MDVPEPSVSPSPETVESIRALHENAKMKVAVLEFEAQEALRQVESARKEAEALAHILRLWGALPAEPSVDHAATENLALSIAVETILRDRSPLTHEEVRNGLLEMGVDPARFGPNLRQYFKTVARLEKRKRIERTTDGRLKIGPKSLVA